jgi:hypothetical protein
MALGWADRPEAIRVRNIRRVRLAVVVAVVAPVVLLVGWYLLIRAPAHALPAA